MAFGAVWVPVTLLASSAQTLRNAMQRDLIGALGAVGAAQVRFLFGLPFAALFLLGLMAATGLDAPPLTDAQSRLDSLRRGVASHRHRHDAGGDAHQEFRRRGRLYEDGSRANRGVRSRRAQRSSDGRADRGDRPGDDRSGAHGRARPQGPRGRLAGGGPRARLRDLLRFRGDRLSLGGHRCRQPLADAVGFGHPGRWASRSRRRRSRSIWRCSTARGRARFSPPGAPRCLPASWARSLPNSGSSPSR